MEYENHKNSYRNMNKTPRRKKPSKIPKILSLILAGLVAFWLIYSMKGLVVSKFVKYETAAWGMLENKVSLQGAILYEEKVVSAPATGVFSSNIAQGEKVPAGRVIGYIQTQASTSSADLVKVPVKAPVPGLVSYYPDGLEGVFKQNILDSLDIEKISVMMEENRKEVQEITEGEMGKPLLKIVDNLVNPYLYFLLPKEEMSGLKLEDQLTVEFPSGDKKKIRIKEIKEGTEKFNIIGEIFHAPDLALKSRFIAFNLIFSSL